MHLSIHVPTCMLKTAPRVQLVPKWRSKAMGELVGCTIFTTPRTHGLSSPPLLLNPIVYCFVGGSSHHQQSCPWLLDANGGSKFRGCRDFLLRPRSQGWTGCCEFLVYIFTPQPPVLTTALADYRRCSSLNKDMGRKPLSFPGP